jgi:hypothetical protein
MTFVRRAQLALLVVAGCAASSALGQGSVFVTGHDPDFHATLGGNTLGAQHIIQTGVGFIQDPGFNPFVAAAPKFLLVESFINPPSGHTVGAAGVIASGYIPGVSFDLRDASTLNQGLDMLGQAGGYSGIVVCSDFGGVLTQAELDILNNRAGDIAFFVNHGGGIFAMAEGNSGAGLTPNGGWFNFIPTVVSSQQFNESEVGNHVTPFGAGLGLTDNDVNGNASHNVFTSIPGLNVVDFDSQEQILTAAGRIIIPAPGSLALLGFAGIAAARRRR